MQKVRVDLRKTKSQLDREQRQKRTHIATLEEAQAKQLSDKDGQITALQVSQVHCMKQCPHIQIQIVLVPMFGALIIELVPAWSASLYARDQNKAPHFF